MGNPTKSTVQGKKTLLVCAVVHYYSDLPNMVKCGMDRALSLPQEGTQTLLTNYGSLMVRDQSKLELPDIPPRKLMRGSSGR